MTDRRDHFEWCANGCVRRATHEMSTDIIPGGTLDVCGACAAAAAKAGQKVTRFV